MIEIHQCLQVRFKQAGEKKISQDSPKVMERVLLVKELPVLAAEDPLKCGSLQWLYMSCGRSLLPRKSA